MRITLWLISLFLLFVAIATIAWTPLRHFLIALHHGEGAARTAPLTLQESAFVSYQAEARYRYSGSVQIETRGTKLGSRWMRYGLYPETAEASAAVLIRGQAGDVNGAILGLNLPAVLEKTFYWYLRSSADEVVLRLDDSGFMTVTFGDRFARLKHDFRVKRSYAMGIQLSETGRELEVAIDYEPHETFPLERKFELREIELRYANGTSIHNLYVLNQNVDREGLQAFRAGIWASHRLVMVEELATFLFVVGALLLTYLLWGPARAMQLAAVSVFLAMGLYTALFFKSVLDPSTYFQRDNDVFQYPLFVQLATYLRHVGEWPSWFFSCEGGVWTAVLANNYFLASPHRLLGFMWSWISDAELNLIYKTCYALAVVWIFTSYWWVVRRTVPVFKFRFALFLAFVVFSGANVSLWHQEQTVATLFFLPLLVWLGLELKDEFSWPRAALFGALLGLSLNLHYPQIIFILVFSALVAALVSSVSDKSQRLPRLGRMATVVGVVGVLAVIGALPLLYSYWKYAALLTTEFRGQGAVESQTFQSYLTIHEQLRSSVHPLNFIYYFAPDLSSWASWLGRPELFASARMTFLDDNVLKIPQVTMPVILLALFWVKGFARQNFAVLLVIFLLALTALGKYGPLIHFYWFTVPGIGIFRQWYHFLPPLLLVIGWLFFRAVATVLPLLARWFQPGVVVLVLIILIVIGNRSWLLKQSFQLTTVRVPPIEVLAQMDSHKYLQELVFHTEGLLSQNLVRIREANPVPQWSASQIPLVTMADGVFRIQFFKADRPPAFSQFDDGGWVIADQAQIRSIQRKSDAWLPLLTLAYLSLTACYLRRRR